MAPPLVRWAPIGVYPNQNGCRCRLICPSRARIATVCNAPVVPMQRHRHPEAIKLQSMQRTMVNRRIIRIIIKLQQQQHQHQAPDRSHPQRQQHSVARRQARRQQVMVQRLRQQQQRRPALRQRPPLPPRRQRHKVACDARVSRSAAAAAAASIAIQT